MMFFGPCDTDLADQGRVGMTSGAAGEEREQVIRWMDEGKTVLGIIIKILNDFDRLNGALDAAEKETQRLQGMLTEFQRISSLAEALQRECEQLRAEVSRLEADNERSRREREEIAQWFTTVMNQAAERLRAVQPSA